MIFIAISNHFVYIPYKPVCYWEEIISNDSSTLNYLRNEQPCWRFFEILPAICICIMTTGRLLTTNWLTDDCLLTAWKLSDNWRTTLENCLLFDWRLYDNCMMTAGQLTDWLTTACWVPEDCLTTGVLFLKTGILFLKTACCLPDDCLTTAWWLLDN